MQHSEKINDLFLLNISDLETSIVSLIIRFNGLPQKLIEEAQSCVNDFKQKMFGSLIQLIQLVSHYAGQHNPEIKSIADALEQQVVKCKQTHLLFQMKAMVNCKIKALLETLHYNHHQSKTEVEKQLALLQESLMKIEQTLNQSPAPQPTYITPLPRRQQLAQFSQDGLTPILSEEAEKKAKVQFITPDQYKQHTSNIPIHHEQFNTQFTPLSNVPAHLSLENSVLLNKTLNSFNNENQELKESETRKKSDNIQQLIQNAFESQQLPQFGGVLESSAGPVRFENEFMSQCLNRGQFQTEQESDSESQASRPQQPQRQSSLSLLTSTISNQSPNPSTRQTNSTNAKQQVQRKKPAIDSVNLMSKLNQAGEKENVHSNRITAKRVVPPVVKRPTSSKTKKPICKPKAP